MNQKDYMMMEEILRMVFALIHQKMEIAEAAAKNQNAPKYMYEQAADLQQQILERLYE